MNDLPEPMTQNQLLDDFAVEWRALMAVIDGVEPNALINRSDAAGWNTRDHLVHLGDWLNSILVMIRDGEPQWNGAGVTRELFESNDIDAINEVMRQRSLHKSIEVAVAELRDRHETMVGLVQQLSDEQLLAHANTFAAESKPIPICYFIDGDGPYHYREHRGWIETLLSS